MSGEQVLVPEPSRNVPEAAHGLAARVEQAIRAHVRSTTIDLGWPAGRVLGLGLDGVDKAVSEILAATGAATAGRREDWRGPCPVRSSGSADMTEPAPASNAAMIAELQAVSLAIRMFGLDGLSAGNVTLAGARHPVESDGEGEAKPNPT